MPQVQVDDKFFNEAESLSFIVPAVLAHIKANFKYRDVEISEVTQKFSKQEMVVLTSSEIELVNKKGKLTTVFQDYLDNIPAAFQF